jgi:predicted dehydrogenase
VAAVNYNIRYYPLNVEAAERIRRGDLGRIYSVCGSYVQDWLLRPTDYNWRVLAEEGGELRAVADIGTHWLDLVHAITGLDVEAVCADLSTVHPVRQRPLGEVETFKGKSLSQNLFRDEIEREARGQGGRRKRPGGVLEGTSRTFFADNAAPGASQPIAVERGSEIDSEQQKRPVRTEPIRITTDDSACILLRFGGGAKGCLWVSQVTAGRKNCLRYEIAGSEQAMAWCSEQPNETWLGHRDRPNESLIRDPALVSDRARLYISYPGGHNEGFPDTFKQCFRAVYDTLRAQDRSAPATFPTFADGHREILLCEAILKSHRQGRWVTVKGARP